jgi:hypothetical protein
MIRLFERIITTMLLATSQEAKITMIFKTITTKSKMHIVLNVREWVIHEKMTLFMWHTFD